MKLLLVALLFCSQPAFALIGKGSLDTQMVIVEMSVSDVEKMLPSELKLANPGNLFSSKKHPVLFLLGKQNSVRASLMPAKWGVNYDEVMVSVPFVYHQDDPKKVPRNYIPKLFLNNSTIYKIGSYYGYAKEMAYIQQTSDTYDVYSEDQSIQHIHYELDKEGTSYQASKLKPILKYVAFLDHGVIGQKKDGSYTCSDFNWNLEKNGMIAETEGTLEVMTEFVSGLGVQKISYDTPSKSIFSFTKKIGLHVKTDWDISFAYACY